MSNKSKDQRYEEAVAREELFIKRTPAQQIALLDKRLGVGVGAKKERARLAEVKP